MMKDFSINEDSLFDLDSVLEGQNLAKYDLEIKQISDNLWIGVGEFEELLQPFFNLFLKNELLPSLYINYLSMVQLNNKFENVSVKASTSIIDMIGKKLLFQMDSNRKNFDDGFMLKRSHFFINNPMNNGSFWKRILRVIKGRFIYYWKVLTGVDVIYLNAGKLKKDFSLIPNSLNALYIFDREPKQELPDLENLKKIVISNIEKMNISIPSELIIELLNQNLFNNLLPMFKRIFILAEFIQKNNVQLVISSSSSNEFFLALLAAAKISKTESLIISHGMPSIFNPKLNNYCSYQGLINNFEPIYDGAKIMEFKASWFE